MKTASKILLALILLGLVSGSSCSKSENGGGGGGGAVFPWDLLPGDNEISGWAWDGSYETATTTQELWDWIDGAGQVFIDHGFSSCARQIYKGSLSGSEVKIEYLYIYDQTTDSNAYAVYHDPGSGPGTPWTDDPAGTEARINDFGMDTYVIDFWESKYFVTITIWVKSSEALDVIKLFCHNVSDKIPGSSTATRLPSE